jgi:hypothetical protein
MAPDTIYTFLNLAILPPWLLLFVLPHHRITQLLIHAIWVPLLLGPLYIWAAFFGPPPLEGAGFGSLEALMKVFQSPVSLIAGWVHYLIFDLFIGAWIVRDARRLSINHWLTVPFLFATMMAGPAGLMAYLLLRWGKARTFSLNENAGAA